MRIPVLTRPDRGLLSDDGAAIAALGICGLVASILALVAVFDSLAPLVPQLLTLLVR